MRETQIETEELLGGECTNENVEENRPHSPGADECVKVESSFKGSRGGGDSERETESRRTEEKARHDKVLNRMSLIARCA